MRKPNFYLISSKEKKKDRSSRNNAKPNLKSNIVQHILDIS